ncbi:hypothetical protein BDP27DRAFT_1435882 [Rhodocollybia butyracea]|uniref:Uncharacterized protein n=1 Tax=Rhodocollybia butyracea TaxID=206335 RepID=A0A9P5P2C7_9AGAR|nr:hypothetical protein BDP27DRAFT_1435882 [Rhodocollybia butyracea]
MVELLKSTIHTVNWMQITNLKAKQEALKYNKEFWKERQGWDGARYSKDVDEDIDRVAEVLDGWTAMDHRNAGEWEDIAGEFWQTESGKRQVFFLQSFNLSDEACLIRKYKEYCTQCNRTECQNQCFASQVEPMADAYMAWYGALGKEGIGGGIPGAFDSEISSQTVIAVDLFRE